MVNKFGFKQITLANWLNPDEILKGFARMSPSGEIRQITSDEYLRDILKPTLAESVPADVRALFEVARGAMVYGYFFYPLYTLAAEQLFRVCESAVAHRCLGLEAPNSKRTFKQRIDSLVEEGIIPRSDNIRWDAIRHLRNSASHPERQTIITPGNAIGDLENIASKINSLFNSG